ncbi:MAG: sulfatase-like hydrolase/transferase [Pseudomonadota bacterium]
MRETSRTLRNAAIRVSVGCVALFIAGCGDRGDSADVEAVANEQVPPNFLILIGDDMGKETLSCYDVSSSPARTPNINELCANGVVFDSFWTQPFCSPTRATILTGQYSASNSVRYPVMPNLESTIAQPEKAADANPELRIMKPEDILKVVPEEAFRASRGLKIGQQTLPGVLKALNPQYVTGAFGKWHLADPVNGGVEHPTRAGFDEYDGVIDGTMISHFAWKQVTDGVERPATGYTTSRIVDDTQQWISAQEQPWFAWVAFTTPHDPYHLPPLTLLSEESAALDGEAVRVGPDNPYFRAAIEAMDTEIGRLLASIPADELANTYVLFISDNGSPRDVASAPYSKQKVKGTVYQGGIDMPFIVVGPGIEPGRYPHLANSTDIFASVLELAGVDTDTSDFSDVGDDSVSFAPGLLKKSDQSPRDWIYADGSLMESVPIDRAIRNTRYKLANIKGAEFFFDLEEDPFETINLLDAELSAAQTTEYESLRATLEQFQ